MLVIDVINKFESLRNPKNIEGMKRFAIPGDYGISAPELRNIAKEIKDERCVCWGLCRNTKLSKESEMHNLALELWKTAKHEARMLCALIDDPKLVTEEQMDSWSRDFDSWDLTDNTCMHLFRKTSYAYKKINEWSKRPEEFVKRAAFTLIACVATHDKKSGDEVFIKLLDIIKRESSDERNFVKKAVNWALRGIGKRNKTLNAKAIILSKELISSKNKTAHWIGADALRELNSPKVKKRIKK